MTASASRGESTDLVYSMRLAVWNIPPADLFVSGLQSGSFRRTFGLIRTDVTSCEELLKNEDVDAALLPTFSILKHPKDFSAIPAVALSSWRYPFARLFLDHGLDEPIQTVAYDPRYEQERAITEILLREHYRMNPDFVVRSENASGGPQFGGHDADLLVGSNVPRFSAGTLSLDIGQEWYELAQYPMVWGLFATLRNRATPELIRGIRDGIRLSERQRLVWIRSQETSADLHAFYKDDLRFRLDDLAVAGLTELMRHLFFYQSLDEMPDLPFSVLSENGDDDENDDLRPIV